MPRIAPGAHTEAMGDVDGAGPPARKRADQEHTHANVTGGWLRPAVFGMMDGLVSNFALIAGVAGGVSGAGGEVRTVVLAGLAGLAAGAFSMAAGEYTSVASQAELAKAELAVERRALMRSPQREQDELTRVYTDRGVDVDLARQVVRQLSQHPDRILVVHAREELGVDPGDLPAPMTAAAVSFLAFAIGAVWPLIPYLLGASSLLPSLIISLVGMFLAGAMVSRVTTRSWWWTGTRQLLLGATAAALTYAVGTLVGTGIS